MDSPLPHLGLARPLMGVSVLLALLIWESWKPFFPFFERAVRTRSGHLARNLAVGLLNAALIAAGLSFLWGATAAWSAKTGFGILHRAGIPLWALPGLAWGFSLAVDTLMAVELSTKRVE